MPIHRRLYDKSGRFNIGNLQDWQHAAMYSAFMTSGAVDLLGFCAPGALLPGTEHVWPLLHVQLETELGLSSACFNCNILTRICHLTPGKSILHPVALEDMGMALSGRRSYLNCRSAYSKEESGGGGQAVG